MRKKPWLGSGIIKTKKELPPLPFSLDDILTPIKT